MRNSSSLGRALVSILILLSLLAGTFPSSTASASTMPLEIIAIEAPQPLTIAPEDRAVNVERISVSSNGTESNGTSDQSSISADGVHVAFRSVASNLVEGDTNGVYDIFVHNRETGTTVRVNVSSDGAQSSSQAWAPSISADGRYVAFSSQDQNLAESDYTGGTKWVFVHDRDVDGNGVFDEPGQISTVLVSSYCDMYLLSSSGSPSISGDGRYVAFGSSARTPDDMYTVGQQIFIHDRDPDENGIYDETGQVTTTLVSVNSTGEPGNGYSNTPRISFDGRYVVFLSVASNLVEDDTYGESAVFVHDIQASNTVLVKASSNFGYHGPSISADGRYIAFRGSAPFWGTYHYMHDRDTDANGIFDEEGAVSTNVLPGGSYMQGGPALSADGRFVAFSHTLGLVSGDDNGKTDVYMMDLDPDGDGIFSYSYGVNFYLVSVGIGGEAANDVSPGDPSISADGSIVAFASRASNLVLNDANTRQDIFVATMDVQPPTWPEGSALWASNTGQTVLTLSWTAAQDNIGVTGYRVYQGSSLMAEPGPTEYSCVVSGLTADTEYTFNVEAGDQAGHWTSDGPSVTVKTQADSGELAALVVVARPGGIADLSWDPASLEGDVSGYRIYRATGSSAEEKVGEVAASMNTFQDTGLAAETGYTYTVRAFDDGDIEWIHTISVTVTTPSLSLDSVFFDAQRNVRGQIHLLSTLTITAQGEANRQCEAEIGYSTWFDEDGMTTLPEPRLASANIALNESTGSPGEYTGQFEVIEGIHELVSLSASLSDGFGHMASAEADMPLLPVSGALSVEVVAPETDLIQGSELQAWSSSAKTGNKAGVDGAGTYLLSGLAEADDYSLFMRLSDNKVLAREDMIPIRNAFVTNIAVTPQIPAQLRIRVVDPSGDPVQGATVTFNDNATGYYIAHKLTGGDGWTSWLTHRLSEEEIKATVRVDLPYRAVAPVAYVLSYGDNEEEIQLEVLGEGTLAGSVTDSSGNPIGGVVVTAVQTIDGRMAAHRAVSDASGTYQMAIFEGEVRVEAASPVPTYVLAEPIVTNIVAGSTTSVDLVMDVLGPGTISVNLNVTYVGGDQQEVIMDWAEADRLKLEVKGATVEGAGYPVPIYGRPGQTVEVCLDGSGMNLPQACQQVTLDDLRNATASFNLDQYGARIRGTVYFKDMQPMTEWSARVYVRDPGGEWIYLFTRLGRTEHLDLLVPAGGPYRLEIEPSPMFLWYTAGVHPPLETVELKVEEGEVGDIGDIVTEVVKVYLSPGEWEFDGPDGGRYVWMNEGPPTSNIRVESVPFSPVPGGTVTFRTTFINNSGGTASDVRMLLQIPAHSSLVPEWTMLNFLPVKGSLNGSILEVPIGTVEPGASGVVHHKILIDDEAYFEDLSTTASIAYRTSPSGPELREEIGRATVYVYGVVLQAPERLTSLDVTLSGVTVGEGIVRVYDDNVLVGEVKASPGGYWKMAASLPYTGSPQWHNLMAKTDTVAGTVQSKVAQVLYDPDQPVLTRATIFHTGYSDSLRVSFDPRDGVTSPNFVFLPYADLKFDLEFSHPERVRDAYVFLEGADGGIASAAMGTDGIFRAVFPPSDGHLGEIRVGYGTLPDLEELTQPLSEAGLRDSSPWPWSAMVIDDVVPPPPGQNTSTLELTLPGSPDIPITVELSVEEGLTYTPSEDDLIEAEYSGVPVYGIQVNSSKGTDELTIDFSAYVLADALPVDETLSASVLCSQMNTASLTSTSAAIDVVKVSGKVVMKGSFPIVTTTLRAGEVGWKLQRLSDLLDLVDEYCDPIWQTYYHDKIDETSWEIMENAGVQQTVAAAGVFISGATGFVGGVAYGAITGFVSYAVNKQMDHRISVIGDGIARNCPCEEEEPDKEPPAKPTDSFTIATPRWLIDPSGYVYEAVPENRLEGVTATILQQDPDTGDWFPWNADDFGQENPQTTNFEGCYGWDVLAGNWQVYFEMEGYADAWSDELAVPPPHFDVNIGMMALVSPQVTGVTTAAGGSQIDIAFSKYMKTSTLVDTTIMVSDENGDSVSGTVAAVSPVIGDGGPELSTAVQFVPDASLEVGSTYTVRVSEFVQSYAGIPMGADYETSVTIADSQPPVADAGGPYSGNEGSAISFNGSASYDTGGEIVLYQWDFDSDGVYDASSSSPIVSFTWEDDYSGNVVLTVTDDGGLSSTDTAEVTVYNVAPDVFAGPDRTVEACLEEVAFNGSFTDPGTLDTHTITWDFGDGRVIEGTLNPVHTYSQSGEFTVTLSVTDDDGGHGSDTLIITAADTTPPSVNAGEDITVEQTCYDGAPAVLPDPVVTDLCDPDPEVVIEGMLAIYPPGDTVITVTATDFSGNSASDTIVVSVVDTTAPYVSILYPVEGQEFWAGDSIDVEYLVSDIADPDPVITVDPSDPVNAPLPVGDLTITVTATDASGNTGSAEVTVSVVPVTVSIDFDPDTLNLKSTSKWVTVYIEMPEGYDVRDIDGSTVMLNGEIPAYLGRQGWAKAEAGDGNIMDHDGDGILERMVKFELDSVRQVLSEGREVEITITGACDGIGFMGTTYIRVINRGRAAKR